MRCRDRSGVQRRIYLVIHSRVPWPASCASAIRVTADVYHHNRASIRAKIALGSDGSVRSLPRRSSWFKAAFDLETDVEPKGVPLQGTIVFFGLWPRAALRLPWALLGSPRCGFSRHIRPKGPATKTPSPFVAPIPAAGTSKSLAKILVQTPLPEKNLELASVCQDKNLEHKDLPRHMPGRIFLCIAAAIVCNATQLSGNEVDFTRDIRPILSANCFSCHGPDPDHREADLRLDTSEGAIDDSSAFVAGDLDASEAWQRIISTDPDSQMPPPDSGKEVTPEQRELMRRWIQQGAAWSQHWAFVPPTRPEIPTVSDPAWVRNPIDAFVLARLDREGLAHSPAADRATLLRRVSLDLIGLPPKLEDLDAFLAVDSEEAFQKVVTRLLNSKHYGERWGRWWLDAARYADSDGFEKDKPRQVWFYRDWLINALNEDLPYNEFIVQQIAGDLYPNASQDNLVATGFLRNSMINEEGGIDPEQFRMEAMFDRMDALGKSVLGLTIGCAQCHNHKYDSLSQADYYRMFAFLNNCHEAQIAVYTEAEQLRREEIYAAIQQIDRELKQSAKDWRQSIAIWEQELVNHPQPDWHVAKLSFDDTTIGGQKFLPQHDGSYLAQGYAPTKFRPKMTTETDLTTITGLRLELLTDPNLPRGGPGRSVEGTCGLSEVEVEIGTKVQSNGVPQAQDHPRHGRCVAGTGTAQNNLRRSIEEPARYRRGRSGVRRK